MSAVNAVVAKTLKWFLIIAGAATSLSLLYAIDIGLFTPLFGGIVDYTPSSVPALRHWGIMIFGLGALMVAAAFRPWLRFETQGIGERADLLLKLVGAPHVARTVVVSDKHAALRCREFDAQVPSRPKVRIRARLLPRSDASRSSNSETKRGDGGAVQPGQQCAGRIDAQTVCPCAERPRYRMAGDRDGFDARRQLHRAGLNRQSDRGTEGGRVRRGHSILLLYRSTVG